MSVKRESRIGYNSGNNEWYTPSVFIEAARTAMVSIDVDPASSEIANRVVKADRFFTAEDDGLAKWWGRYDGVDPSNVWLNPPYSQPLITQFTEAVVNKYKSVEILQACVLVNNATETGWFQNVLSVSSAICFVKRRIRFVDIDGKPASGSPLQGQVVLYMGIHRDRFCDAFKELGQCWRK